MSYSTNKNTQLQDFLPQEVFSFLKWEQATRDTIDVKRSYIDAAGGDLVAGVFLSQVIFWHLPSTDAGNKMKVYKHGCFWIAKKREDWWDECRITPKQFDRARKLLEALDLIESKVMRFNGNPIVHIRVRWHPFLEVVNHVVVNDAIYTKKEKAKCNFQLDATVENDLGDLENGYSPKGKNEIDLSAISKSTKREFHSIYRDHNIDYDKEKKREGNFFLEKTEEGEKPNSTGSVSSQVDLDKPDSVEPKPEDGILPLAENLSSQPLTKQETPISGSEEGVALFSDERNIDPPKLNPDFTFDETKERFTYPDYQIVCNLEKHEDFTEWYRKEKLNPSPYYRVQMQREATKGEARSSIRKRHRDIGYEEMKDLWEEYKSAIAKEEENKVRREKQEEEWRDRELNYKPQTLKPRKTREDSYKETQELIKEVGTEPGAIWEKILGKRPQ